jgi:hypothetical protein
MVDTTPPLNCAASFWQRPLDGSINLFALTAPTGSIIDVVVESLLADTGVASSVFYTATDVIGVVYYLALDGPANHTYVPVSLTTTF